MAIEVKYNGKVLASLSDKQYTKLATTGKVLEDDILVEVSGVSTNDGKATIVTVATEEEMDALFATPPEQITNGGSTIVQYTGETGKYTKNAYYLVEVSAQ